MVGYRDDEQTGARRLGIDIDRAANRMTLNDDEDATANALEAICVFDRVYDRVKQPIPKSGLKQQRAGRRRLAIEAIQLRLFFDWRCGRRNEFGMTHARLAVALAIFIMLATDERAWR